MEEYLGTIKAFGFNFAPRGWAQCHGQLLPINQYDALFSLLGTTYGGDGRTTFGLPDLRGHVPIGDGTAPGFSNRRLGQKGGSETNVLNATQLPAHHHAVNFAGQNINASVSVPAVNDDGTLEETENNIIANHANAFAAASAADTTLGAFSAPVTGTANSGNTGSSAQVNNMQPFLSLNFCIYIVGGIYPPRS